MTVAFGSFGWVRSARCVGFRTLLISPLTKSLFSDRRQIVEKRESVREKTRDRFKETKKRFTRLKNRLSRALRFHTKVASLHFAHFCAKDSEHDLARFFPSVQKTSKERTKKGEGGDRTAYSNRRSGLGASTCPFRLFHPFRSFRTFFIKKHLFKRKKTFFYKKRCKK